MFDDDSVIFIVVINEEEQYSIWPEFKAIPAGWRSTGKSGTKAECLAHIREIWTDMRPASLRRQLAETTA
jgi:MbtH protein